PARSAGETSGTDSASNQCLAAWRGCNSMGPAKFVRQNPSAGLVVREEGERESPRFGGSLGMIALAVFAIEAVTCPGVERKRKAFVGPGQRGGYASPLFGADGAILAAVVKLHRYGKFRHAFDGRGATQFVRARPRCDAAAVIAHAGREPFAKLDAGKEGKATAHAVADDGRFVVHVALGQGAQRQLAFPHDLHVVKCAYRVQ